MRITASIATKFNVCCPSCGNVLLAATRNGNSVPDGGYIIEDGDSLFGVYEGLSEEERARAWDAALGVGTCRACGEGYYFANVSLSDAPMSDLVDEYLHQNLDPGSVTNYVCSTIDGSCISPGWLMHEWMTKIGLVQHHYLGPWPLTGRDEVETEYGVMACMVKTEADTVWDEASRATLSLWNEMRRLCSENTAHATS